MVDVCRSLSLPQAHALKDEVKTRKDPAFNVSVSVSTPRHCGQYKSPGREFVPSVNMCLQLYCRPCKIVA